MSRAAGQRLAALLAQRHYRASSIAQKSKHPTPPPPAYGLSKARPGQASKVTRDPAMTPANEGPGAFSQAASESPGGTTPTTGPPFSETGTAASTSSKPPQAADTPSGSVPPQCKTSNTKMPSEQTGQAKEAQSSGAPARSQPKTPQQSHFLPNESSKGSSNPPISAKTAQAAHVTASPAPPEPVNPALEFSATQPKAAAPMSPPSLGLGSAENHAAKAAQQVTASPAHPQPVKAAPEIQVTQPKAAASSSPATSAKVGQAAEHVSAGIASRQPVKAAPALSATQPKASAAMSPPSPALGNAETHGARAVQPAEHVTAGTAPPQPVKPAPELSTTLPKAAAAMSPPSSGQTTTAGPGPSAGKAQQQYYKGGSAVKGAASGSGIGSSAASKPPQGNAWLLSKALPVDVRLLAAGAASIGALYYYSSRDAQKPQGPDEPQLPEESELGFAPPSQSQEESSFGHQDVPEDPESARLQQWEVLRDHEVQSSNDAQQHFEELHAEETETSVQPEVVHTDAPQEAETNTAQLQQDEVLPAPEASKHATDEQPLSSDKQLPSSSRSPGDFYTDELAMESQQSTAEPDEGKKDEDISHLSEQHDVSSNAPREKSTLAQTLEEGISSAAKAVEHSIKHGQPLDFVDTRSVTDLLNEVGSGDLSALDPSISGSFDKGKAEQQVDAAHAEVDALKGTSYVPKTGDTTVQDLLGISDDLSAEGLLVRAIERGEDDGTDWHGSKESLIQARADEQTIQVVLGKVYAKQQGRLSAALAVAEANADRAEQIEREAASAQLQFAEILEETLRASERQREHDLRQQETILATAAAEYAAKERQDRLEELDQVRTFVNSLGAAFSRRSDEAQASNLAHQLSLNVFALEDALAHGRPYAAAAFQVARSAPEDELVASACKALPEAAAERGIPTMPELLKRAAALDKTIRPMAYLEPNKGGIVSLGLSRLAAALKIQETVIGEARKQPATVDEALARMQDSLAQGQLADAAAALEAGTRGSAAHEPANAWAQDARRRALADQTAALLQAHACSLAASQA